MAIDSDANSRTCTCNRESMEAALVLRGRPNIYYVKKPIRLDGIRTFILKFVLDL